MDFGQDDSIEILGFTGCLGAMAGIAIAITVAAFIAFWIWRHGYAD